MKRPAVLFGSVATALVLLTGCGGKTVSADSAQGNACKAAVTEYFASVLDGLDGTESPSEAMKAFQDKAKDADKKAAKACKDVDDKTGAEIVAAAQTDAMAKMESKMSDKVEDVKADTGGMDMTDTEPKIQGADGQDVPDEVKDAIKDQMDGNG